MIRADGGDAVFAQCNVADSPQLARSIKATVAAFSGLHMLVNCAGIVHVGKLHEYDEEAWDYLMGVNAKAIFISLKYAVPHLGAKRAQLRASISPRSAVLSARARRRPTPPPSTRRWGWRA